MRTGDYRNYYKGHMDKIKGEGRGRGGRLDWLGWVEGCLLYTSDAADEPNVV